MRADAPAQRERGGLLAALGAYAIWGFLPLYLLLVATVPALEFVGWRIVFTAPACLVLVAARRQMPALAAALRSAGVLAWLAVSAILIAVNWVLYVWAVQRGHVLAASLGYYINPLLNVLLGTIFLRERLSRLRWGAVALAGTGVLVLAWSAAGTLLVSLGLAVSFALYGLVRKRVPVGSVPGLTVESLLLLPLAVGLILLSTRAGHGVALGVDPGRDAAILASGLVTAVPLLLFATAARRLPYSTLGFVQFLAPSIVFVLGLTVFAEPLQPAQAICFAFIWCAAALFIADLWLQRRAAAAAARAITPA
ncbi:EamA family transporter RarD [Erythrobacteraceae bacterium CFH 75059]|uniref:EamA family transporter RarD n=1 Tax=Qipengyuania thermophila TaxID=2509361 RepID=UPI00101F4B6D|nr:EamA family transporter RarD [Qipengyuania thermophila]TCD04954.1 EamA family transporter RarD [Erythrobacteraceae bacterium CFH 75059]